MPALYSADEIIEIAGGRLGQGMLSDDPGSICTDTRRLVEGSWFLALNGQEFDGHDFLGDAYCRGALGCIVEERHNYPIAASSFPLIIVGDCLFALRDLARNWRRRLAYKIIAVIADDKNRSSQLATRIYERLSLQAPSTFIDVVETGTTGALERLLDGDQSITSIVLNMAPDTLEEAQTLASAFSADVMVFLDEPFDYLRLTAKTGEVRTAVDGIVASMDRKLSCIVAAGAVGRMFEELCIPVSVRQKPPADADAAGDQAEGSDEDYCLDEATKFFFEPEDTTASSGMQFEP